MGLIEREDLAPGLVAVPFLVRAREVSNAPRRGIGIASIYTAVAVTLLASPAAPPHAAGWQGYRQGRRAVLATAPVPGRLVGSINRR